MSDQHGGTAPGGESTAITSANVDKGKGKAIDAAQDVSMGEEEDSSDEETGAEDQGVEEPEAEDEDNMEEIDTDNIIADGRRTLGKTIDFAQAAQNADELDEDEEDDEDFEASDDEMKD